MGHDQFEENPKIPRFSLKEMNMKSLDEILPCNFEQHLGMSSLLKKDLELQQQELLVLMLIEWLPFQGVLVAELSSPEGFKIFVFFNCLGQ